MTDFSGERESVSLNYRITIPSVAILVALCIPLVIWQEESTDALNAIFAAIVNSIGSLYILYSILMVAASLFFILTRYGSVVLGDPGQKPRFSWFEYLSIIIAMGIGSTIMRTGTVMWAPIAAAPPFGLEPQSLAAMATGNGYAMYLWSFQTFAIFSVGAPAIGYLLYVRKVPVLRMSEVYRPLLGDRFTDGTGGIVIDILFMVAIIAGAATFLGLGTPIVTAIVSHITGWEATFGLTFAVTLVWIALFTASVLLGLEKGIKNLSTLNMYLAALLGIFILVAGPSGFILSFFFDTLGALFRDLPSYVLNTGTWPEEGSGSYDIARYTIFWWAYGATWSLLHSIFAAKISEGRTIRELLLAYLLAPLVLAWVATGILGGLGAGLQDNGSLDVFAIVAENGQMAAIAEIVASVPFGLIVALVFTMLTMTFFATTLDSTTFTVSAYTDDNDMHKYDPAAKIRLFWSVVISVFALVLMKVGGLVPLEVTSGLLGLPIIFVQLGSVWAAKKMIDQDRAWETHTRKPAVLR